MSLQNNFLPFRLGERFQVNFDDSIAAVFSQIKGFDFVSDELDLPV